MSESKTALDLAMTAFHYTIVALEPDGVHAPAAASLTAFVARKSLNAIPVDAVVQIAALTEKNRKLMQKVARREGDVRRMLALWKKEDGRRQ